MRKRALAALLALVLALSLMPGAALAAELPADQNKETAVTWLATTADDQTITQETGLGKTQVLVFFSISGACGNSNTTLWALSNAEWAADPDVEVVAIGCPGYDSAGSVVNGSAEALERYITDQGLSGAANITFAWMNSAYKALCYLKEAGVVAQDANSFTYAVNVVLDGTGKLRYAWMGGYQAAYYTGALAALGGADPSDSPSPSASAPATEGGAVDDQLYQAVVADAGDSAFDPGEELALLNDYRASKGLGALALDDGLQRAAMQRAAETAVYYSHTRPDGTTCFTADGFTGNRRAENIAAGYGTVQGVVNGWLNSDGHRANIETAQFQSVGLGRFVADDGTKYWVQVFSDKTPETVSAGGGGVYTVTVAGAALALSVSPASLALTVGEEKTVAPRNTNQGFPSASTRLRAGSAVSTDPAVASVEMTSDGAVTVTALAAGSATVTVGLSAVDGGAPATVNVPVTVTAGAQPGEPVPPSAQPGEPAAPGGQDADVVLTQGFNWRYITESGRDEYVADGFAADARFYYNDGLLADEAEFEALISDKVWDKVNYAPIPGVVVEFYRNDQGEIAQVRAYDYTVVRLTDGAEVRTSNGARQVRVPGVVNTWTDADKVTGYAGLAAGDVVLYYRAKASAEALDYTYVIEKAEKVTGRVTAFNMKGQITVNGVKYQRTGLTNLPDDAMGDFPGFDPASLANWDRRDDEYTFYLDKSGSVCYITAAPKALTKAMFTVDTAAETYTGRAITKSVYGVDDDVTLVEGTDYTVSYKNNTTAGTATLTITGMGGYTGALTYYFTIKPVGGTTGGSSGGSSGGSGGGGGGAGGTTTTTTTTTTTGGTTVTVTVTFTDVAKNSWYETGVNYVVGKGLFQGMGGGIFAPERNMTRAMLMTVLARLDGQSTDGGAVWYEKGMAWAVTRGISDGTRGESNVTREQMVTMLFRYVQRASWDTRDLWAFADGDSVSDWAREAMAWAVGQGILTGKDGGRLDPQGTATRAEVATILQRFVEKTGR